jgi:hypothetical protein
MAKSGMQCCLLDEPEWMMKDQVQRAWGTGEPAGRWKAVAYLRATGMNADGHHTGVWVLRVSLNRPPRDGEGWPAVAAAGRRKKEDERYFYRLGGTTESCPGRRNARQAVPR